MDQNQKNSYRKMLREIFSERNQKRVIVVNGAPGSGKTSYVKQSIQPNDIALDLDYLTSALVLDDHLYGNRESQLGTALVIRDVLMEQIENRFGKWHNAYVITAEKDSRKVHVLANRLDAELVTIQATKEECIEHIRNDSRRNSVADKHIQLVENWYQK